MSPKQTARRWPTALLRGAAHTQAMTLAMTLAVTLLLGACAPKPAPPLPGSPAAQADRAGMTLPRTPSTDASLPSASSVFDASAAAAGASAAVPAATVPQARANAELTPAQESRSMPLPGQANDHSVPVTPPKAAASR